ncbi:MAG: outer membrane lipoprotein-sorting protein [Bacteroidales bacterium]|nr:outer membrane lipoprotein-sorting protein [Bacteroidales bacterium]
MKTIIKSVLCVAFILITTNINAQELPNARQIIDKANQLMRGNSSYMEATMKIIRPTWERTLSFKAWAKGTDYSIIYITSPAKEKGQVFLKRDNEMWNWVPSIERMIKIPPSMMMQSWMGSDMTNDDLVKESSVVEDYSHKILGEEMIKGYDCYKLELIPKEDAAVVWSKIVSWISKKEFITLKNEYYDEFGDLINMEVLSKIKDVGDRTIPTYFEIIPLEKEGNKTTMEFEKIEFNKPIKDSFFSIQNMKRIR